MTQCHLSEGAVLRKPWDWWTVMLGAIRRDRKRQQRDLYAITMAPNADEDYRRELLDSLSDTAEASVWAAANEDLMLDQWRAQGIMRQVPAASTNQALTNGAVEHP